MNGSPFTIEVTGTSEQFQKETQTAQTKSLEEHQIGSVCKMSFTISQTLTKQKLTSYVTSPSGQRKEAVLKQINQAGQTHVVEFTATEVGEHIIEIIEEESKKNIPGTPIKFQVGKLKQEGGVQTVRALGPGLEGGVVGQKGKNKHGQLVKLYDLHFTMSYYAYVADGNNNDEYAHPYATDHHANYSNYGNRNPYTHNSSPYNARTHQTDFLPINHYYQPPTIHSSFDQQHSTSSFSKSTNINHNSSSYNEREQRRRYFLFNEN